jgi:Gluconate 2-dehydrogenase subunit 3
MPMTRREALKTATALVGGVLIAPAVLTGCAPERREAASTGLIPEDKALLGDIADTLLPPTAASPGAEAAGVGATMFLLLDDCQPVDVQLRVANGLQALRATCRTRGAATFD